MNYYNDFEPKACHWLEALMQEGLIPNGQIDNRSIADVKPEDIDGYYQCHFFAGIGGWSRALQLAGHESRRSVWTGSCPCQPFSCAGKGLGPKDERHLWPEFFRLIKACRPEYVFGEQVAAAIGKGWLDGVCSDLEGEGYSCGATVLGAHSVTAPHIRQRCYWLGHTSNSNGRLGECGAKEGVGTNGKRRWGSTESGVDGRPGVGMADTEQQGLEGHIRHGDNGDEPGWKRAEQARSTSESRKFDRVANSKCDGGRTDSQGWRSERRAVNGWDNFRIIHCRDGKLRRIPVEPEIFPLVDGFPSRVAVLKGIGNAIVPKIASAFITAAFDCTEKARK